MRRWVRSAPPGAPARRSARGLQVGLAVLVLAAAACSAQEVPGAASSSGATAAGSTSTALPTGSTSTAAGSSSSTSPAGPEDGTQTFLPEIPAPATAWEQAMQTMAHPIPVQTAVDAFSTAFRPIEGATPTDLEPGYTGSGTGPMRWMLGRWDDLTPAQQSRVEEVLAAWESGAAAAAPTVVPASMSAPSFRSSLAVEPPQALVHDMVVNLETLLGRSPSMPVSALAAGSAAEVDNAYAMTVTRDAAGGFDGPPASCKIYFAPDALKLTGADAVALAAHEVFHCFEYDLGTLQQAQARPAWIIEGMAEWAGEAISGGSSLSTNTWGGWLDTAAYQPLFSRAYTAIGFYAHLDDSGIELWSRIDQALLASDTSSEAAYLALLEGAPQDLIDSWAAGYYRDPDNAPLWDQDGPGITFDAPLVDQAFLAEETAVSLAAAPYAAFFLDVDAHADVITFESPGAGLAMLADGTSMRLPDLHGTALCTTGSCSCPDGTPGAGTVFTPTPEGVIEVAATGHTSGSDVTVVGWSIDRFCRQERCQVGKWESGAWHVPGIVAGGRDAPLWITGDGEGYVAWRQAGDLYGWVPGATAYGPQPVPLKIELEGASHFYGEYAGADFKVTSAAGSVGITPFVDFGDGWFETSDSSSYLVFPTVGGAATFACAGDTLVLNDAVEFWRVSNEAEIPPEAGNLTPTTVTTGEGPPPSAGAPPLVDPCTLLSVEELQALSPDATEPDGPDDLPTTLLSQCTFLPAAAVQVYGPLSPDFFLQGTDMLGLSVVEVPGIGDWALAQVYEADPEFGIEEAVALVAAGTGAGTVALVPFVEVLPESPEFATLTELVELALSRL